MTERVAVVGAGIGGLATATLLARQGALVQVFERAPRPRPIGAGLLLHPSGARALHALGLDDSLLARAEPVVELVAVQRDGRLLSRLRYGALHPGLTGHGLARGALFAALLQAAQRGGVEVVPGAEIRRADEDRQGASLADAAGRRFGPFDLVVVADGGRSTLRGVLPGFAARVSEYTHGAVWATGPCGSVRHRLHQVVDGSRHLLGVLPHGDGQASLFWGIRLTDWEALRAIGYAAFRRLAAGFSPAAAEILAADGDFGATTLASYRRVQVRRWTTGRFALLGDAAHAMSPHLGQGANLALGDALSLARALTFEPDVERACRRYERERRSEVRPYAVWSRLLAPYFQSDHWLPGRVRDVALPRALRIPSVERAMVRVLAGEHRPP